MAQKCHICDAIESFERTGKTTKSQDGSKRRHWHVCSECGADGVVEYEFDSVELVGVTYLGNLHDPVARERGHIRIDRGMVLINHGEEQGDPDAHFSSVTHPGNTDDPLADL